MPSTPKKIPFPIILAALFIVAVINWLAESEQEIRHKIPAIDQEADYYMENFSLTETNEFGEPIRWLSGDRMAHYTTETLLTKPKLTLEVQSSREEIETWLLSADHGNIQDQNTLANFNNNVVVQRVDGPQDERLELQTSSLSLNMTEKTAQTDAKVSVTKPGGVIQARGMELNFNERQIELLAEVKAQYAP